MKYPWLYPQICFDGEGGAGGAGGEPGGEPGGGDPGGGDPPQPFKPDGMPDHLLGTNDQETITNLLGAYSGSREELAKFGERVDGPDKYEISLSDGVMKSLGDLEDDKAVGIWRNVAHKHQLTQEQFNGAFEDFMSECIEAGIADTPIDVDAELEKLVPSDIAEKDPEKRRAEGSKRMVAANNWIEGLENRKALTAEQATLAKGLTATAEGVQFLESLRKLTGEHGVQPGGDRAGGGAITRADLRKRQADPRNDPNSPKYEKAYYDETQRLYQNFFGSGPQQPGGAPPQ